MRTVHYSTVDQLEKFFAERKSSPPQSETGQDEPRPHPLDTSNTTRLAPLSQ